MNDNYDRIHVFEKSGLGTAPFKYIGCKNVSYQACADAPIQPGGSCQYCGTGIYYQFWLRSADGKEFYVGSECIHKSGDTGLRRIVDAEIKKMRMAREDERIKAAKANLEFYKDTFMTMEHPHAKRGGWWAQKTLYDFYVWMFRNSGHTGRLRVTRMIEGYLRGVAAPSQEVRL